MNIMSEVEIEKVTEVWHYAGRRLNGKGQIRSVWVTPEGDELHYKKTKQTSGTCIGARYEMLVERAEEGTVIWGSPSFIGGDHHPDAGIWKAADIAAQASLDRKSMERKMAGEDEFTEAILIIKRAMDRVSPRMRAGLLAHIIGRITRG